jgi:protein SCO1/2
MTWFFVSLNENKPIRYLPYFGPKHTVKANDTLFHDVPAFKFTDQYNHIVDTLTVREKIYVAEFFFATCQSICPVMNRNLKKIYERFRSRPDFLIISHTVDPENDSVAALKEYARSFGVNDQKWLFVTGEKSQLYNMARKGYLLNADEGDGGTEDFIHTPFFALVDKERHIRGFYDGTDTAEVNRLEQEILLLYRENAYRIKNN